MDLRRVSQLLAAALVTGLLLAPSASALETPSVKASKHQDGPFKPAGNVKIGIGASKSLYWRVKSKDPKEREFTFLDGSNEVNAHRGYKIEWFDGRDKVTAQVTDDAGYQFELAAGAKNVIRAVIKRTRPGNPDGFCIGGQAGTPFAGAFFGVNGACD